jgi:hypothetical protein
MRFLRSGYGANIRGCSGSCPMFKRDILEQIKRASRWYGCKIVWNAFHQSSDNTMA